MEGIYYHDAVSNDAVGRRCRTVTARVPGHCGRQDKVSDRITSTYMLRGIAGRARNHGAPICN